MKILYVIHFSPNLEFGGGQVYVRNLINGWKADIETEVYFAALITSAEDKCIISRQGKVTIKEYYVPNARKAEVLDKTVSEIHPDLLHIHGEYEIAIRTALAHRIPCIATIHSGNLICPSGLLMDASDSICKQKVSDPNCFKCTLKKFPFHTYIAFAMKILTYRFRLKLAHAAQKTARIPGITPLLCRTGIIAAKLNMINLLQKIDGVVAPCNRIAEALAVNGIRENVYVIPHGVPTSHQTLPLTLKSSDPIKFYYSGRIDYAKGIHIMLKAFMNIPPHSYELHILGSADNKNYISKLKTTYKELNVFWHGFLGHDKMLETIKEMHIMIHPAICLEVFGLSIAEALINCRPVIATRCGGPEMQIKDGINGWLIPPNNSEAITEQVRALISSPELIETASGNCTIHPVEKHISQLKETYESILEKI